MTVELVDEQDDVAVDHDRLLSLGRHVLDQRKVPDDMVTSLLLVDEATMANLNATHMGAQGPTDVLAFPMDEPGSTPPDVPAILGDVVLCPAVAHAQAARGDRAGAREVELLVVHGILHLLGMDHVDPVEEAEMFGLTDRLLESWAEASTARG